MLDTFCTDPSLPRSSRLPTESELLVRYHTLPYRPEEACDSFADYLERRGRRCEHRARSEIVPSAYFDIRNLIERYGQDAWQLSVQPRATSFEAGSDSAQQ